MINIDTTPQITLHTIQNHVLKFEQNPNQWAYRLQEGFFSRTTVCSVAEYLHIDQQQLINQILLYNGQLVKNNKYDHLFHIVFENKTDAQNFIDNYIDPAILMKTITT